MRTDEKRALSLVKAIELNNEGIEEDRRGIEEDASCDGLVSHCG